MLLTYDEGGGYFDHVAPPARPTASPTARASRSSRWARSRAQNYDLARRRWSTPRSSSSSSGTGSAQTGQLGARDALVANLGSLLDPQLAVPED